MTDPKPTPKSEIPPGTLDMLILRTLTLGPLHGYGIAQHIHHTSGGVLKAEQGSLYPALERLLGKGWVTGRWDQTPTGRRARYYKVTRSGRAQLSERFADYERVVQAIGQVMTEA